jgi:hypothetical protein
VFGGVRYLGMSMGQELKTLEMNNCIVEKLWYSIMLTY